MDFGSEQWDALRCIFAEKDRNGDGMLERDDLDAFFWECGIDREFGPALHRVLAKNKAGVRFDDVLDFFSVLVSGKTRTFYRYVFEAMDLDGDGQLRREDIMQFASLMNECLDEEQAGLVLTDYGADPNGSLRFDNFWELHRLRRGSQWQEEEDTCE
jgi:Ca2+-binding EF-hand superfamily protein